MSGIRRAALLALGLVWAGQALAQSATAWFPREEMESHRVAGEERVRMAGVADFDIVYVEVSVDSAGNVVAARPGGDYDRQPSLLPAPAVLEHALAIARQWRFRPLERDGHPVAARGEVSIVFLTAERLPIRHLPFPEVRRDNVSITLERSGCFGSCPSYSVTVRGDGHVSFAETGYVLVPGAHEYAIPPEAVDALVARFRAADFWSLDDAYTADITDSAVHTLTFRAGGQVKMVSDYVGVQAGMPDVVSALEGAVDETADTARWIEGNAHTVDALAAEHFDFGSRAAGAMLVKAIGHAPDAVVLAMLDRGFRLDTVAPWCRKCAGARTYRQLALKAAIERGRPAIFDRIETERALAGMGAGELDRLLMKAARTRSLHLVQRLLAHGANARATDLKLGSSLIQAVENDGSLAPDADQSGVVRLLLARHVPLEARDEIDWTALQTAAERTPEIVRLLVDAGAKVDAHASGDQTALFVASDEDVALILLAAGADRTLRDSSGRTLAEIARRREWTRVEALLAAGK